MFLLRKNEYSLSEKKDTTRMKTKMSLEIEQRFLLRKTKVYGVLPWSVFFAISRF